MLYYLLYEKLFPYVSPFRVFRYTTFRTAFASLTALFLCVALGPWLIKKLREFQIGQYIREEGPKSHQAVGGPAVSVRLDRNRRITGLRLDRLSGRLCQDHQAAEPWPYRPAQA